MGLDNEVREGEFHFRQVLLKYFISLHHGT